MRILVLEDDSKISSFVTDGLKRAGFAVDRTANGLEALSLLESVSYDAAVIDIMVPGRDGMSVIAEMRKKKIGTPVIILSARRSVEDRVNGLQGGSDDYLTKPFAFSELLARIQALIRRASAGESQPAHLRVQDLSVDLLKREVTRSDEPIELQPREFALLEYLMRNVDHVVSKTLILEHVWDYSFSPQTNVVDVLVCRLRNKIDRNFDRKMIHTIRGVGYVLKSR